MLHPRHQKHGFPRRKLELSRGKRGAENSEEALYKWEKSVRVRAPLSPAVFVGKHIILKMARTGSRSGRIYRG